ncbi:MAG: hypothetical protein JW828_04605 [Sedimentisphaerales bacterium]|nr:hypothetical protein [Sedimentisphaerales bacterium]
MAQKTGTFRRYFGFTLVELQMALIVTAIILSSVVSLSYALNAAQRETEHLSDNQTMLRYATSRIGDLIRYSDAVVAYDAGGQWIELWSDANGDGLQDASERFFIEIVNDVQGLPSVQYRPSTSGSGTVLIGNYSLQSAVAISNIQFVLDPVADVRFVGLLFDMETDGKTNGYQICGAIRSKCF